MLVMVKLSMTRTMVEPLAAVLEERGMPNLGHSHDEEVSSPDHRTLALDVRS